MSRDYRLLTNDPEIPRPPVDPHWRDHKPVGSKATLYVYQDDRGWYRKTYTVLHYFPFVVKCKDRHGFIRCFNNWEFQHRQRRRIDKIKGGYSFRTIRLEGDDSIDI